MMRDEDALNINIKTPEDYRNNLRMYLLTWLVIMCEDAAIDVPPLIICNENYNPSDRFNKKDIDTDIIYIDIKSEDYVGTLLHEFGHYIGLDEWGNIEFETINRDVFQVMFNMNIMT